MKEINIYKSLNNGEGGSFDRSSNNSILVSNNNFCCIYIKNETNVNKKLLKIDTSSIQNFSYLILKENGVPLLNTLTNKGEYPDLPLLEDFDISGFLLPSDSFITLWFYLEPFETNIQLKRYLNIIVEYTDEY